MLHRGAEDPLLTFGFINHSLLKSRKWTQQIGSGVSVVIFLVDVARYDQYLVDPGVNEALDAIMLFDSVLSSTLFSGASSLSRVRQLPSLPRKISGEIVVFQTTRRPASIFGRAVSNDLTRQNPHHRR